MLNGRRPCANTGVSLIEMVVGLAIVAILFAMAVPSFSGWMASLQVRTAAEGILSGLQLARTEAAKRNQQVSFNLVGTTGAGWTVTLTSDGSVIQSRAAAEGSGNIAITTTPTATVFTFNSLGQRVAPAAASGTVTLALEHSQAGDCQPAGSIRCMNVTVPVGGQIKMCDPALPSSNPAGC